MTMEHKVSELEGALLDAAVAKAEGKEVIRDQHGLLYAKKHWHSKEPTGWSPSRWWEQGGPIIERESIAVFRQEWSDGSLREWRAGSSHDLDEGPKMAGPTPLIAAMRAYVASKFGDVVEVP